jgi:hypothetical protein
MFTKKIACPVFSQKHDVLKCYSITNHVFLSPVKLHIGRLREMLFHEYFVKTHRIFCCMTCLNGLLKKDLDSVVVAQLFKNCVKTCYILVWVNGPRKGKMGPVILMVLITRHTRALKSCNCTSNTDMRFSADQQLILWDFPCSPRWNQPHWRRERVLGPHLRHTPHEITKSQVCVLVHGMDRRVCEPQLSYVDATAAVLLYFVLTTQTLPSAVQVQPWTSSRCLQFRKNFDHFSPFNKSCRRVPHRLKWNILQENFSLICELLSSVERMQKENSVIWHMRKL